MQSAFCQYEDFAETEQRVKELTHQIAQTQDLQTKIRNKQIYDAGNRALSREAEEADHVLQTLKGELEKWSERLAVIRSARSRDYLKDHRREYADILQRLLLAMNGLREVLEAETAWRADVRAKGIDVDILPNHPVHFLNSKIIESFSTWIAQRYPEIIETESNKKAAER